MHEENLNSEDKRVKENRELFLPISVLAAAGILTVGMVYSANIKSRVPGSASISAVQAGTDKNQAPVDPLVAQVLPRDGVGFPVAWGDLGKKLSDAGVIDAQKFEALYAGRGGMTEEMKSLLSGSNNGRLKLTPENSGYVLNLLWALGLSQQSEILTKGPIMNTPSVRPEQFASTGGWTLASGDTMSHFAKHNFLNLTASQQKLVENVAKNIYRPCCGNSTYFPDCNHGMGMLGLLELMASQGVSEADMYKGALYANAYWFPDSYLVIASYFKNQGISWDKVDPKLALSSAYSSSGGFQNIAGQVTAPINNSPRPNASGCGT